MKIRKFALRSFVLVLTAVFLMAPDIYALDKKAQQEAEEKKEKIISTLKSGISLIKYEIQRDQAIASSKILIPALRKLRQTLKNNVGPKNQLINNLQLLLSEELTSEIGSLRATLQAENKIMQGKQTSKRARRVAKNSIKKNILIKEQVIASFENFLSGVQ